VHDVARGEGRRGEDVVDWPARRRVLVVRGETEPARRTRALVVANVLADAACQQRLPARVGERHDRW
jgi:hypothetical protein